MELIFQSIFNSPKTTISGIVGAVVWFLGQNGILLTPEQSGSLVVVVMLFLGFFAKDSTATHTEK